MSNDNKDQPDNRYLESKNSLAEDQQYLSQLREGVLQPWAKYRAGNKFVAPEGLAERVVARIERKQSRAKRIYIGASAIAASFVLFAVVFFGFERSSDMTYEEKKVLLEQALNSFPDQDTTPEIEVLYEDELIVIYYEND